MGGVGAPELFRPGPYPRNRVHEVVQSVRRRRGLIGAENFALIMTWVEVVDAGRASGKLAEAYDKVGRKRGRVANIHQVFSLNPEALEGHLDLYMSLLYRTSGLTRSQREMIGVVVSGLNRCGYCVVHHSEALSHYLKSPGILKRLESDYRDLQLTERDRAMLDYCAKLTSDPSQMTERDVERLRETGFSDSEILDINLIASYFNFVNRVVLGLGVDLETADERRYRY